MMTLETKILIQKYGGATPRYTSFPTAVQFHDGYTRQETQSNLAALKNDEEISIYIHIPFCHSLCHYCGCHTKIVHKTKPISDYVGTLCREIELAGRCLRERPKIRRIHFGGGSPNYASMEDLERIVETIRNVFCLNENPAIDMECDPRLLDVQKIEGLLLLGVERFSLGIQDFNEKVQAAINRRQSFALIQKQMKILREYGVKSINFDLIVGLPEQTQESIINTLEQVISLKPDRIAVFGYAHVPWMKKHQKLMEKFSFPSPELRFVMTQNMQNSLHSYGYEEIGIDHYALPYEPLAKAKAQNNLIRNFQGYTDDTSRTILGFGLSAISQFEGAYAQNTTDAPTYRRLIEQGVMPIQRGMILSPKDRTIRDIIMTLMCNFEIDFSAYPQSIIPSGRLAGLQHDGLIEVINKKLKVTEAGKPFTRVIASAFDPYFSSEGQRHAKAI